MTVFRFWKSFPSNSFRQPRDLKKKNEKKESRKTHQKKRAEICNRVKVFDKQKT